MVEIEVRLLRGSVYFVGEAIRCQITFTNTAKRGLSVGQETRLNHIKPAQYSRNKVMGIETVAWASAQIHCQCTVNDYRIKMPENSNQKRLQEFGPKGEDASTCFMPSKGQFSVATRCLLLVICVGIGNSDIYTSMCIVYGSWH